MRRPGADDHLLITSANNKAVQLMRSLGRRKTRQAERAFLVEGRRLTEEAIQHAPTRVRMILAREDVPDAWCAQLPISQGRIRRVAAPVFDAASDVEHAQGIAAICDLAADRGAVHAAEAREGMLLVLDRLRDPGNVGTALRSAAAAGIRAVLTSRSTADPFAPKVVRAGMGAHFRLSVRPFGEDAASFLREAGRDVVYADMMASEAHYTYDWSNAAALIVGGETEALSPELASLVNRRVHIPMQGSMESLNAGVAASVLLFEAQRQGALAR